MKINKDSLRNFLPGALFLTVVFASFLGGFYAGKNNKALADNNYKILAYSEEAKNLNKATSTDELFDVNLYSEVWDALKQNYVDKAKIKDKDLFYGSLKGLAQSLNDPYTVFMDPKDSQEFSNDLAGTFEGIGAEVGMRNDIVTIIAPLDGMPAQKAGVRAGDKIYAIDGKGTKVTLTILRGTGEKPKDIVITRGIIVVKSVKTEMRSDGIYVIKVSNFNDDTLSLFNTAIDQALIKKPKGIILDLRNNPGGYLETAVAMASEWVEAGPIVSEKFSEDDFSQYPSNGRGRLKNFKTVVLVNNGSASASEIVAGALRDYKKATLLGEQTYGKGSVQTLKQLSDGSTLKVTIAKWLTPAGDFINEIGIKPEIEVKLSQTDIDKNIDPQLNKALEILKQIKK